MKFIFNYIWILIFTIGIYLLNRNLEAVIQASVFLGISACIVYIIDYLSREDKIRVLFYGTVGLLLSLLITILAYPILQQYPAYITVGLLGLLSTVTIYIFCLIANSQPIPMISNSQKNIQSNGDANTTIERDTNNTDDAPFINVRPKILDTSVIIDGRVISMTQAGFLEGPLVIPNFVLREMQLISDSSDSIKRSRGRRGLDMLNELQNNKSIEVHISYEDYTNTREVDAKLIQLAKEKKAILITNDYNLNKVAKLQGLTIWNINNLVNILKPVVLPGEEMEIQILKEGKDNQQGVGYLDDGTMVVVEKGGQLINKRICARVTSVIQTNAGKMIFSEVVDK